jgi:sec-independent protein translocase protein TatC
MINNLLNKTSAEDKEMGFFDHIEELRWHIIRSLIAISIGSIVVFVFYNWFFENVVFAPAKSTFITYEFFCMVGEKLHIDQICFHFDDIELLNTDLSGQLMTQFTTSFIGGFIMSFPYIFWEIWRFIKPALQESELNKTRPVLFFVSVLFAIGVAFGYYVMTPFWLAFAQTYTISSSIKNLFSLDNYISGVSTLVFCCGLIFELPVIVFFLSKLGLMTPDIMRQYRRHAYVSIVILGAVITPQTDVFSLAMICLPLWVLYEMSIYVSARVEKQKLQNAQ